MFEEQEQKLLSLHLIRARRDYKNRSNVYPVSAFDEHFDQQLKKLVIFYCFDFQAIALHLYFKFPQYAFRMKPQAVQYRWYQLTLELEGERIRQQMESSIRKPEKKEEIKEEVRAEEIGEEQNQQVVFFELKEKKEHYQAAMRMAACLDEQQEEGFMVYRPKFIIDSQFKLERQRTEDSLVLSAILENGVSFQFGAFSPPQAAPLNLLEPIIPQIEAAAPNIAAQDEQQYLDDDWQAYESD